MTDTRPENEGTLFERAGVYLAWVTALAATGGSLYFSEILGFIPCSLCWVQRIFMYPLAIVLGIAAYRRDRSIIPYALPLSVIGGCVSLFHYLLQKVPSMALTFPCRVGVPCSQNYIDWFGFITIPFLALTAFIMITVFLWLARERG
ncbi:disulfide oxidoreductase [Staphylospora marina]|uniref:disulfide oxidoreductase n=1 Tax=Staphylospora marina TaxID=2490858 RepID=UPI000F5BACBF|nr:disulfide oxidoreductase [Staphylospora marina]